MKINYQRFPLLELVRNKTKSPFVHPMQAAGITVPYSKVAENIGTYNKFWQLLVNGIYSRDADIDYISEPIRKLVDLDIKTGDKLHRERDSVHDASGLFIMSDPNNPMGLAYAYNFFNHEEDKRVYFTVMQTVGNLITAYEIGFYSYNDFPHISMSKSSFNKVAEDDKTGNYLFGFAMQMALQFLIFKHCAELETKIIDGRKGRTNKAKLNSDRFTNDIPLPITVIDSTWFTQIVRTEGFKVGAHLRWQAYGPGRREKKLILIKEFQKHGYTRRAQIEN